MRVIKQRKDVAEETTTAIKKPVQIECVQINEDFEVHTMEGVMKAKAGDWLIIGVEGEMYACDERIFHKTYSLQNKIDTAEG